MMAAKQVLAINTDPTRHGHQGRLRRHRRPPRHPPRGRRRAPATRDRRLNRCKTEPACTRGDPWTWLRPDTTSRHERERHGRDDGGLVGAARPRVPQRLEGVRAAARAHRRLGDGRPAPGRAGPRRQRGGRARHLVLGRQRRAVRRHGALGLGQVDARPLPVAPDRADGGRGPHRRRGRHRWSSRAAPRAAAHQDVHGLPALRPAPPPPPARQRRLRPRGAGQGQGQRLTRAGEMLELVGLGGLGDSTPTELSRRHAAAGGVGPGPGQRSRDPAVRRAVLRARPADPAGHAGRGRRLQRELKKTVCSSPTTSPRPSSWATASPS